MRGDELRIVGDPLIWIVCQMKVATTVEQAGGTVGHESLVEDENAGVHRKAADVARHYGLPTGTARRAIEENHGIRLRTVADHKRVVRA